ncbi:probable WRKY transcription factor 48 [Cryptomeria japonica]|uniref:probable WRKY transcription factor 48 n=1 Tax=Cryptomeria japonica TaxID=3369 RepID=UPI0025ACBF0A|nr:probable WRKY transcription factor 48 [Cryptomeria japonica]
MEIEEGKIRQWDKIRSQELDNCVRNEVNHGCQLARELETKLNSTQGPDLYQLLASSSAQIVATFSKALEILDFNSNSGSYDWQEGLRVVLDRNGERFQGSKRLLQIEPNKDNRNCSPRSVGRSSASGSPPSEMSEGSPVHSLAISAVRKGTEHVGSPDNGPTSNSERREISRKRKSLPRRTIRISANNSEPGNDMPPDDGHTWRKYGQKDILGAQYPRSYYRCTHKNDLGCQATKQVQRADDDPSVFEITYRGPHTCHTDQRIIQIQLPFSIGSNIDSNLGTSNTLVFGTECNPQSNSSTLHGLPPNQLHPSSNHASTSWFGGSVCKVESESSDSFGKSPAASTVFPCHNLLHMEENPAHNGMQPGSRTAKISVSPFRDQGSNDQGESSTEIITQQHNGLPAVTEGELVWPNFAQIFSSPTTPESNYIPAPTATMPLIHGSTYGQQLLPSESDLTDVVSGHTSAADSPMLDMDTFSLFNTVNFDSFFQFERSDPF